MLPDSQPHQLADTACSAPGSRSARSALAVGGARSARAAAPPADTTAVMTNNNHRHGLDATTPQDGSHRHRHDGTSNDHDDNNDDNNNGSSAKMDAAASNGVVVDEAAVALLQDDPAKAAMVRGSPDSNGVAGADKARRGKSAGERPTNTVAVAAPATAAGPAGTKELLNFDDVPQHLQFNPYIVTGYRPMSSFWGSIRSLFYLHNETVNIVTHGVPIVYILMVVPGLVPWGRLDRHGRFLAWCHLVGAVSPWIGSFVYHLFMNLRAGEQVYNRLLRLDMFGIWICQSFGALPMVSATVHCLPWNVRWFVISSYCMLSLCGLYKAMTAWSPWDRRLSFALPWISRLALCILRALSLAGGLGALGAGSPLGSPNNMLHLVLQTVANEIGDPGDPMIGVVDLHAFAFLTTGGSHLLLSHGLEAHCGTAGASADAYGRPDGVSLVGGVVGAVYFPEKYFPGRVDFCLNSHNIMHVLTVAAVYSMHCATMHDLEWMASADCQPPGPPWTAGIMDSLFDGGASNRTVEL